LLNPRPGVFFSPSQGDIKLKELAIFPPKLEKSVKFLQDAPNCFGQK
jgi:hypothetical protein